MSFVSPNMENWKLFLKNAIHMQKIELSSNIAGGLDFSIQAIKRHTIAHLLLHLLILIDLLFV